MYCSCVAKVFVLATTIRSFHVLNFKRLAAVHDEAVKSRIHLFKTITTTYHTSNIRVFDF